MRNVISKCNKTMLMVRYTAPTGRHSPTIRMMKLSKTIIVASFMLAILCGRVAAKNKTSKSPKGAEYSADRPEIFDWQGQALGRAVPKWAECAIDGDKAGVKSALNLERDMQIFLVSRDGDNLDFLKTWADQVDARAEVASSLKTMIAQTVQTVLKAQNVGAETVERKADLYSAMATNVSLVGLQKLNSYWIKTRRVKTGVKKPKKDSDYEYKTTYMVVFGIDSDVYNKQLTAALAKVEDNSDAAPALRSALTNKANETLGVEKAAASAEPNEEIAAKKEEAAVVIPPVVSAATTASSTTAAGRETATSGEGVTMTGAQKRAADLAARKGASSRRTPATSAPSATAPSTTTPDVSTPSEPAATASSASPTATPATKTVATPTGSATSSAAVVAAPVVVGGSSSRGETAAATPDTATGEAANIKGARGIVISDAGDFIYKLNDTNDGVIIIGVKKHPLEDYTIVIPDTIEDYPVVQVDHMDVGKYSPVCMVFADSVEVISSDACNGWNELETVKLPSEIVKVGSNAFNGCPKLTTVEASGTPLKPTNDKSKRDRVRSIDYSAFGDCTALETVQLPPTLMELDSRAFYGCISLTSVEFGDSITDIGSSAFRDCTRLKEVMLPPQVKIIYDSAFEGCTGMEKLLLPAGKAKIGQYAFKGCTALVDVAIPKGAKHQYSTSSAFNDCSHIPLKVQAAIKKSGYRGDF